MRTRNGFEVKKSNPALLSHVKHWKYNYLFSCFNKGLSWKLRVRTSVLQTRTIWMNFRLIKMKFLTKSSSYQLFWLLFFLVFRALKRFYWAFLQLAIPCFCQFIIITPSFKFYCLIRNHNQYVILNLYDNLPGRKQIQMLVQYESS